tara:strand:- start:29752 stop:30360 length:609 start_codon:yes stop_codon:yes gene_type:complete
MRLTVLLVRVRVRLAVDSYEHANLPPQLKQEAIDNMGAGPGVVVEYKPHFHEWASVMPGMICVSRKARNATFRNYVAAETATPVIGCAACIPTADAKQYYVRSAFVATLRPRCSYSYSPIPRMLVQFAGVCRSKTVRPIDDGNGPMIDEYFTLAIGGMVTLYATYMRLNLYSRPPHVHTNFSPTTLGASGTTTVRSRCSRAT